MVDVMDGDCRDIMISCVCAAVAACVSVVHVLRVGFECLVLHWCKRRLFVVALCDVIVVVVIIRWLPRGWPDLG